MLILECTQGCYGRTEGQTDGSVTIPLCNFVGEGITNLPKMTNRQNSDGADVFSGSAKFAREGVLAESNITTEGVITI